MEKYEHLIISDVDLDGLKKLEEKLKNENPPGTQFWESVLIGGLDADGTMAVGGTDGECWHLLDVLPNMDGVSPMDRKTEIGLYLTRLLTRGINCQVKNVHIHTQYDLGRFIFHICKFATDLPRVEYFIYPTTEEARKSTEHLLSEFMFVHMVNNDNV